MPKEALRWRWFNLRRSKIETTKDTKLDEGTLDNEFLRESLVPFVVKGFSFQRPIASPPFAGLTGCL